MWPKTAVFGTFPMTQKSKNLTYAGLDQKSHRQGHSRYIQPG